MNKYTKQELAEILAKHKAWLHNEDCGERADLSSANLSYADLSYANLSSADLSSADLSSADLRSANLSSADLRSANLSSANLSSANLSFNCFFGGSYGAPVYQACRGFGSRNATLTLLAQGKPEEWLFFTGCFRGTRAELEKAVAEKHGGTPEQANYLRAIEYLVETARVNACA